MCKTVVRSAFFFSSSFLGGHGIPAIVILVMIMIVALMIIIML